MLIVGVGARPDTAPEELAALVESALRDVAAAPDAFATVDRRAAEVGAAAARFGCPVLTFTPEQLTGQPVPHPSTVVAAATGTPSVAEAAALLAAGPGAALLIPKRTSASARATVAVAVAGTRPAGEPTRRRG